MKTRIRENKQAPSKKESIIVDSGSRDPFESGSKDTKNNNEALKKISFA